MSRSKSNIEKYKGNSRIGYLNQTINDRNSVDYSNDIISKEK